MKHYILISGKDSLTTAYLQRELKPHIPYKFLNIDTGAELPEVHTWLTKVEKKLSIKIDRIQSDLEEIIYNRGILPPPNVRFCTRDAKILPAKARIIKGYVYYGIRYDEPFRDGYGDDSIRPIYPLIEHRITLPMVWAILTALDLLPPQFFWKSLYDECVSRLGENSSIIEELPIWQKMSLFAWRSRPNCYFCFYQRQYEYVGLLEHYPELFDKAEQMKLSVGNSSYTWRKNQPMNKIRENADKIKERRIKDICSYILKFTKEDMVSFSDMNEKISKAGEKTNVLETIDMVREDFENLTYNDISATSCGLLCGK